MAKLDPEDAWAVKKGFMPKNLYIAIPKKEYIQTDPKHTGSGYKGKKKLHVV